MPQQTLVHMIASRVRTINWHVKNVSQGEQAKGYKRSVEEIERLCKAFMPSGSGFDSGTRFWFDGSKPSRLIFLTSFHHMNEHGMYDGWTEHRVSVLAEHDGFDIVVGGVNKRGIKDYIADEFTRALQQLIEQNWDKEEEEFTFTNEHGWKA